MNVIIPQLIQIQKFPVAGMSIRTKNEDEFNPETARIPHLWQQFSDMTAKEVQQNGTRYGVYHHYESDASGYYTLTAAIEVSDETKTNRLERINIEAGSYLVFEAKGDNPSAIIKAWQTIWNYFNEKPKYQRAFRTDFELYKSPNESAVYIGIK